MSQEDPQQAGTPLVPGMGGMPQNLDVITHAGPDSMRMPPAPFQQQQGQQSTDWEARYNGLNRRYQEDRSTWDSQFKQFADKLTALESRLSQAPAPAPEPQAKAPTKHVSDGNEPAPQKTDSVLYERLAKAEAERYRDNLILEQYGNVPGLFLFRDNIPALAPSVGDDGAVNDKAQRTEIDRFIKKLQGVTGNAAQQTQQAMVQGWTPGSAPGPQPVTEQDEVAEYHKLMDLRGSPEFDQLPQRQQEEADRRFYQLYDKHWMKLGSGTKPWAGMDDVLKMVQGHSNAIAELQKRK